MISPVSGLNSPPTTVEHHPVVPEHFETAVAPIAPSAPVMAAFACARCEQVPPSTAHPVPTTSVGGTGLPSSSRLASWNATTPTAEQLPGPAPLQRTAPSPVSCPPRNEASMVMFAYFEHVPPLVAQYEVAFSSPVLGSCVTFEPVAQYPPLGPPPEQSAPASPVSPDPEPADRELVA